MVMGKHTCACLSLKMKWKKKGAKSNVKLLPLLLAVATSAASLCRGVHSPSALNLPFFPKHLKPFDLIPSLVRLSQFSTILPFKTECSFVTTVTPPAPTSIRLHLLLSCSAKMSTAPHAPARERFSVSQTPVAHCQHSPQHSGVTLDVQLCGV